MLAGSPYSLVNEMLEIPGLLRRFDKTQLSGWVPKITAKKKLFLTGEGSSRIFPAKNMISLSLQRGSDWCICTEGARQAAEYDLKDFFVIGMSNSGRTRELVSLFEKLARQGIPCQAITATPGSKIIEIAEGSYLL